MSKARVVYAVDMLHYLPLFMAERYLNGEFLFELADPRGDAQSFDMLMSTAGAVEDVRFCVCDPMMVNLAHSYSASAADWPVVIGQLICKVPFWAVNHRSEAFTEEAGFAAYNQLFSYPPPNTGYVLGALAFKRCPENKVLKFRPEKPIDADLPFYLSGDGSVVLEADILRIRKYQETTGHEIVFNYPANSEYSDFCFTALITQKKFLASSEGKRQADNLVKALQEALWTIYHDHGLALRCAIDHFQPQGFSPSTIDGALKQLKSDRVFPNSLYVTRKGWRKSVSVQQEVKPDFKGPSFGKFVANRVAHEQHVKCINSRIDERSRFHGFFDWLTQSPVPRILLAALVLAWPLAFVGGLSGLIEKISHPHARIWFGLHSLLAIILITACFQGKRIQTAFRFDTGEWFRTLGAAIFTFIIVDVTIIVVEWLRA